MVSQRKWPTFSSDSACKKQYTKLVEVHSGDILYPTEIANVAYISAIMQGLSNHPKMTSVIDELTEHCKLFS